MSKDAILALENVRKTYVQPNGDPLPVLDIPGYELERGQQQVVIGRSGCGKTTLLHVIAGISAADEGEITLDGAPMHRLSEAARDRVRAAKIGYVFQTFNLLSGFNALENVLLGMTFAKGRRSEARARELLDRVGLGSRMTHRPPQLSVGEQQRVAVARALANRPSLLLADEPTANVDPANQQLIVDLIREACREESVALMMVTHSSEVCEQFEHVIQLNEINQVANPSVTASTDGESS